ncbi:MAG: hypothetical protein RLZZ316_2323 [Bacteroidota bacterium]|jgi:lysylphosphatidylglycerol synthetase-like protein (DUF2156 family)
MTTNKTDNKLFLPVLIFFLLINAFIFTAKSLLLKWGFSQPVLMGGNVILFMVTIVSLYLYRNAMLHQKTTGFMSNALGGIMLKMFVCIAAFGIYAFIARKAINKPAVFSCVFLYFVYTVLEMRSLLKWNKERSNG